MRLKSLKLAGFKSFANPTTFTFKHNITAIVGPNGCGKSNVIDAIRWVLGESHAKQLRGGAMSDVIFAGTDGKNPRSVASVELTLEHTQDSQSGIRHALNLYNELALRRQITSDGKSSYFINGQKVRRRDVVDVFLGTGLSSRSYAVIEQGMIGRIIEADGLQLRQFIEEAAGVSRYQARANETQKQLAIAKDNLLRLNDLHSTLSAQKATLQEQAAAAVKHDALQTALNEAKKDLLAVQLFMAWEYYEQKSAIANQLATQNSAHNSALTALQNAHAKTLEQLNAQHFLKEQSTAKLHKIELDRHSIQHQLAQAQSNLTNAQSNLLRLDNTTWTLDKEAVVRHSAQLQAITAEQASLEQKIAPKKQAKAKLDDKVQALQQQLDSVNSERHSVQTALAVLDNDQKRLQQQQAKWRERHSVQSALQARAITDPAPLLDTIKTMQAKQQSLQDMLEDITPTLQAQQSALSDTQNALVALDKQSATLNAEYSTLHKLTTIANHKTEHTAVLDCIRLSALGERYAKALNSALAFLMHDGVGTSDLLMSDTTGWILSNNYRQTQTSEHFVPLSALIETPKLKIFASSYLVDEALFADNDWLKLSIDELYIHLQKTLGVPHTDGFVVCGKFVHNLGIYVGAQNTGLAERLAHLARLEELEEALTQNEHATTELQMQSRTQQQHLETLEGQSREYHFALANLERELSQAKQDYQQQLAQFEQYTHATRDYDSLVAEGEALASELTQVQKERDASAEQYKVLTVQIDDIKTRLELTTSAQREAQQALQALYARDRQLASDFSVASQALSDSQARQAQNERAKAQAEKEREQWQDVLDKSAQEQEALLQDEAAINDALTKQTIAHKACLAELATLQALDTSQQTELQAKQQAVQDHVQQATNAHAEVAVALSKVQDWGEQLAVQAEDFNLTKTLDGFARGIGVIADGKNKKRELLAKVQQLSKALANLGAVNLVAKAELEELTARLTPLSAQIKDVEASIETLQAAQKTIDKQTKILFLATLQAVNQALNSLFNKVFDGGQASLALDYDDSTPKAEQWQAELVLMAQPKGKKNSRLAVLSGGEKTLTALSLIFAIFKQYPAPFCVLDEVDAPLDDANVARFTGLIDDLASQVQFIFISHNKLAMQKAEELKGVTMPVAGISSVVSVDLAAASKLIE